MNEIKALVEELGRRFKAMARSNAVVAKPISIGDRHIVPLVELGLAFGGGGGGGEAEGGGSEGAGSGSGGGGGGAAKASPVALLVVEGDQVRLEQIKS